MERLKTKVKTQSNQLIATKRTVSDLTSRLAAAEKKLNSHVHKLSRQTRNYEEHKRKLAEYEQKFAEVFIWSLSCCRRSVSEYVLFVCRNSLPGDKCSISDLNLDR